MTTKQKSNPYNTIGISPEEMTLGQKLASKHLITDPKSRPSAQLNRQSSTSEGESSDWTWETCSDSDPEGNFLRSNLHNIKSKVSCKLYCEFWLIFGNL